MAETLPLNMDSASGQSPAARGRRFVHTFATGCLICCVISGMQVAHGQITGGSVTRLATARSFGFGSFGLGIGRQSCFSSTSFVGPGFAFGYGPAFGCFDCRIGPSPGWGAWGSWGQWGYPYSPCGVSWPCGPRVFAVGTGPGCVPWTFLPAGCGPFGGWLPWGSGLPAGYGPVFGPAGVSPFHLGGRTGGRLGPISADRRPLDLLAAAPLEIPQASAAGRISPQRRSRATQLLASGDRHLRAAVADRSRLTRAMTSYRQAAKAAGDMPDTLLRIAIVAAALGKNDAVEAAVARALAIEPRLAGGVLKPAAEVERVFGDSLAGEQPPVENRARQLLASIFGSDHGDRQQAAANWIAAAWQARTAAPIALATAE